MARPRYFVSVLASVLVHCRDEGVTPITLTVDGESPTGAQRLYERFGFDRSETLTAFHRPITGVELQ